MSNGKRATSTEVPASPPAMREVRKGVYRSAVVDDVVLEERLPLLSFSLEEDAIVKEVIVLFLGCMLLFRCLALPTTKSTVHVALISREMTRL